MSELSYELFQWWVDMAETLQARIPTMAIVAQAMLILEDATNHVVDCVRRGEIPPVLTNPKGIT